MLVFEVVLCIYLQRVARKSSEDPFFNGGKPIMAWNPCGSFSSAVSRWTVNGKMSWRTTWLRVKWGWNEPACERVGIELAQIEELPNSDRRGGSDPDGNFKAEEDSHRRWIEDSGIPSVAKEAAARCYEAITKGCLNELGTLAISSSRSKQFFKSHPFA